ncbi:unnamed protein product [Moneuplotes crassus]|uniref:Uncharacterized protein n=1 Tax=Euplotes crassus TaxID=5936 RepID=A0AAD1UBF8_EUPCR|nr:unnamed protein product [Moneuplotes crassus]
MKQIQRKSCKQQKQWRSFIMTLKKRDQFQVKISLVQTTGCLSRVNFFEKLLIVQILLPFYPRLSIYFIKKMISGQKKQ